jgi:hypothetical protein
VSAALGVFVFQCETTNLYALTLYSSGGNIPRSNCEAHWQYRGTLLLTMQSLATLPIDAQIAMAELRQLGYHMVRLSSDIIFRQ